MDAMIPDPGDEDDRPKLLVVDDEQDMRELFVEHFRRDGYAVQEASNAGEALMVLDQRRPDVVLLDIHMPGMTGVELLRRIVGTTPPIAVIMVTANTDVALAQDALKLGACDYITKPCDFDYLDAAVRTALRWQSEPRQTPAAQRPQEQERWAELMHAVLDAAQQMGDQGRLSMRERLQNAVVLAVRAARHGDQASAEGHLRVVQLLLRVATELGDLPLSATLTVEAVRAQLQLTAGCHPITPRRETT